MEKSDAMNILDEDEILFYIKTDYKHLK